MPGGGVYGFGAFEFDAQSRRLTREGRPIPLTDRQTTLLLHLLERAGSVVAKDELVSLVWGDIAVTDNSVEQMVSSLRRVLKSDDGDVCVETVPRRGYRFSTDVTRGIRRTDEDLDALLAPHRAFVEGRAALETLDRVRLADARAAFSHLVEAVPDLASAHVGLANACIMQFETTRADTVPDGRSLELAARHARDACRLDPRSGEAWATLGFVLGRARQRVDALAAGRRAVMLEPDNWRHHLRLASIGWGEERLRAARRTLALLPGFPLAHWLAATVHVARHALDAATRELLAGIDATAARVDHDSPTFTAVGLHWLLGLIQLSEGRTDDALRSLEREVALGSTGHLYARECAASAWYAVGAIRWRQHDRAGAVDAFHEACARVPAHAFARIGLGLVAQPVSSPESTTITNTLSGVDAATGMAIVAACRARSDRNDSRPLEEAIGLLDRTLAAAEPGSDGWLLAVEPLLNIAADPLPWAPVLARLQSRAA